MGSSHNSSWSIVTEEMFGGQHRSDEAEKARASWGDTSETRQPQRHDSSAIGRVCSCAEKIRMKSLEMVGVVRDEMVGVVRDEMVGVVRDEMVGVVRDEMVGVVRDNAVIGEVNF